MARAGRPRRAAQQRSGFYRAWINLLCLLYAPFFVVIEIWRGVGALLYGGRVCLGFVVWITGKMALAIVLTYEWWTEPPARARVLRQNHLKPIRSRPEFEEGWNILRSWFIRTCEHRDVLGPRLPCFCCPRTWELTDRAGLHIDHIKPVATHPELCLDPGNLQILCDRCNWDKAARVGLGDRRPTAVKLAVAQKRAKIDAKLKIYRVRLGIDASQAKA